MEHEVEPDVLKRPALQGIQEDSVSPSDGLEDPAGQLWEIIRQSV